MTAHNMSTFPRTEKIDVFTKLQRFGLFQTLQYLYICLTLLMVSMTHVNYVFVAEHIDYRCRVPECEDRSQNLTIPSWWPTDVDSKCYKPMLKDKTNIFSNDTCTNTSFTGVLEECQDWIYENNDSIVAELNLACQPLKINFVGGIHNTGMIFSMMFAGWLADKYVHNLFPWYRKERDLSRDFFIRIGRKPTLIICAVGASVGIFKLFVTSYYPYIVLEFLEAVMGSGLYTVGVVLMIEVGGNTKRVLTGVIFSYAVYVGEIVFAFLAMSLKYWKWLALVVYAPMILFVVYIFILKESTRWQMLRGHMEKARKTLMTIARVNKLDVDETEITGASDEDLRLMFDVVEEKEKEDIKVIVNSKEMMTRLTVTSFCFFTSSFLYYGALVHVVFLPGDKYVNFILSAFTSFPGEMIAYYTFNKFGRRITMQCAYFISATFLIAQNYSPASITWLKILFFLLGKLGMVICFTGIYTYSMELFPTSVRGTLFGVGNTAARIGGMLAPLTPLLITEFPALPSMLFCLTAVISAFLLLFTPETKNLPMFDTIAQIESYKISQQKNEDVNDDDAIFSTKL